MRLYRVFPYDPDAASSESGGALFVPGSTAGRIANPDLYRELYLSNDLHGAIAETFGRLLIWKNEDFVNANGRNYVLQAYELHESAKIFDLDNVNALSELGISKPSAIITRDRATTQAWAKQIYLMNRFVGASWWSYYNPAWKSLGLWDTKQLKTVDEPIILSAEHPLVRATAEIIVRQIEPLTFSDPTPN